MLKALKIFTLSIRKESLPSIGALQSKRRRPAKMAGFPRAAGHFEARMNSKRIVAHGFNHCDPFKLMLMTIACVKSSTTRKVCYVRLDI